MTPDDQQATEHSRFSRAVGLRVLILFCVALYSIWGPQISQVIVHDHDESHAEHHDDVHHAPDPHHDDHGHHHDGDEGEHHHHLTCFGNVLMVSVTPSSHSFFQLVMKLHPISLDEVAPSGPVFELIKPPQVS